MRNTSWLMGVSANAGIAWQPGSRGNASDIQCFRRPEAVSVVWWDALQEFRVPNINIRCLSLAECRARQVSVITRSGTKTSFMVMFSTYLRNDALDANDWFANSRALQSPYATKRYSVEVAGWTNQKK
jgi:hypothetical protein